MSIYPISVKKKSGRADSVSGGKDYHLVLITLADNRALFITRFGKKNTWGTGFQVERYDDVGSARAAYQAKHRAKLDKDYDEILIDTVKSARDWAEFRAAVGEPLWNKLGAGNIEWILPIADTKGVREGKTPEYEDDPGRPGHKRLKENRRLVPDPAPESPDDRAKTTPIWGLF